MRRWAVLWGILLMGLCAEARAERTISADAYYDKLRGMWLGEILGNYAGRPKEGQRLRGGLTYTIPWNTIVQTTTWDGDDDTCFEYLYMNVLQGSSDPTQAQIGAEWVDHIISGGFFFANYQARILMNYGEVAPDTGSFRKNAHAYAIDSQITTEAVGAAAPGLRQRAVDLAGRFAGVSNEGYPVHAAQYYAAMYAAAAFESDIETLIDDGQAVVPTTSRTYQVIQDVRDWYAADAADGSLNWRDTHKKLYDKYVDSGSLGRYRDWWESTVNVGCTTLALLYGEGDFNNTVSIAVQAGFDADCNPATAGGLIGLIDGYSGLPADLTGGATDSYLARSSMTNMVRNTTVTAIAAGWQQVAEQQILLAGGSISGVGPQKTYHLPNADAVAPPPERPDPAGPRGLVGAVRAAGGSVAVSASVENHDPADDRKNLDAVIDGIADVTYNGHLPYQTYDGDNQQPAGGDSYQLTFDREATFASLVFYEGDVGGIGSKTNPRTTESWGGYFVDLTVEVRTDGVFQTVGNLQLSEPLDPYEYYQVITLAFQPTRGDAIRIRGAAGGTREYTSIVELEAFGRLGDILPGDANCDGEVAIGDLAILATNYGRTGRAWIHGDFSGNGIVDIGDLSVLAANYGSGGGASPLPVPEPSALLLLAAVALLGRRVLPTARRKVSTNPASPRLRRTGCTKGRARRS